MKKLFFSAIAVCAVVTSALAFSSSPADVLYFDDPAVSGQDCLKAVQFRTLTLTSTAIGVLPYNTVSSSSCLPAKQIYQSN